METSDRGANDHVEALPEHAFEGVEESFLDLDAFDDHCCLPGLTGTLREPNTTDVTGQLARDWHDPARHQAVSGSVPLWRV